MPTDKFTMDKDWLQTLHVINVANTLCQSCIHCASDIVDGGGAILYGGSLGLCDIYTVKPFSLTTGNQRTCPYYREKQP